MCEGRVAKAARVVGIVTNADEQTEAITAPEEGLYRPTRLPVTKSAESRDAFFIANIYYVLAVQLWVAVQLSRNKRGYGMKRQTIRKHLKAPKIISRRSTWDSAFVSALVGFDPYDDEAVCEALRDLGQNPNGDLTCVYCGEPAATWDHLFGRVRGRKPTGYGHHIRNLVPCCRTCNEKKQGKPWEDWLNIKARGRDRAKRAKQIKSFLAKAQNTLRTERHLKKIAPEEFEKFQQVRTRIFELVVKADKLAAAIHQRFAAKKMRPLKT